MAFYPLAFGGAFALLGETAQQKRQLVATLIDDATTGWSVYASPPETVTAPAVVVGPRPPYRQYGTFAGGSELVNLAVTLLVPRSLGMSALDVLDPAIDTVLGALDGVANLTFAEVPTVTMEAAAGVDYVTARIDITVM